jgi:dTDP-4-amino-4,6-dideoxygalactose transaminase
LYVIKLALERLKIDRARFIQELHGHNIGTSVHFIPVHLHPFYREQFGYQRGDFKHAEYLYDRIVSLPLYPGMTVQDVKDVVQAIRNIISSNRR